MLHEQHCLLGCEFRLQIGHKSEFKSSVFFHPADWHGRAHEGGLATGPSQPRVKHARNPTLPSHVNNGMITCSRERSRSPSRPRVTIQSTVAPSAPSPTWRSMQASHLIGRLEEHVPPTPLKGVVVGGVDPFGEKVVSKRKHALHMRQRRVARASSPARSGGVHAMPQRHECR